MKNLFDSHIYTFGDLLENYQIHLPVRLSIKTAETYFCCVENVLKKFNLLNEDLIHYHSDLKLKHHLEAYMNELTDYSINYRNLNIAVLNDFCRFACRTFKIFCDVKLRHIRKIRPLPKAMPVKKLLPKINELISSRDSWIDFRDAALIYLLYGTGMRISEALFVDTSDFIGEGMLLVRNGKNAKERIVYYPKDTWRIIQEYRDQCPFETTKVLWRSKDGRRLSRSSASLQIKKKIGCSPHVLRHSFATHLHSNGCDIFVLSELLGHFSLANTQIYTKIKRKELQKCVLNHHPLAV
ncbi:integrase [Sulfuricurvum sp. IAE1]|uniref:tyrosine-type recombinase/integrase n=1 Tax=Sulfuricurvum sp. IAE1 TaxID=2546102 RepID=UPI00105046BA|nr:tyrosine-type recombinase/integrase [Sulfuricurvum sp. IAE1]TDA63582.1 integrase [Sulfuricurvum sp. IAE1]